jgi:hypothetical protein
MKSVFENKLIAPCGINCGICRAYLRHINPCHGCNYIEQNRPKTRENCQIRICEKRTGEFCYQCSEFSCDRLKKLDNRYRKRYGISEIENLKYIRDNGMNKFLKNENINWVSDKGVLCVHDKKYYYVKDDS